MLAGVAVLALSVGAGCQCSPKLNCYANIIDDISDQEGDLDYLYHPGLDLTRIGKPDWCQDPVNRLLWGTSCCEDYYYGCERGCCDYHFGWHPRRTW